LFRRITVGLKHNGLALEIRPLVFCQQTAIQEYERRIEELERLIGHKEAEIVLLKDFLAWSSPFMEILYRRGRAKAEMMPIVDHASNLLVVGNPLGEAANTDLAPDPSSAAKRY